MSAILERTIPKTEVYQNGQVFNARLISVKDYDEMIEHGILTTDDKVELLNGIIIEKMPKGIKHAAVNDLVAEIFREKLGNRVVIRNQNPVVLDDYSEPEPDLVLAKPPREIYSECHPTPEDILLIVEISDSTLGRDRVTKNLAYAKAGIRQYLVLNLQDNSLEDYREPAADGYQSKQTYRTGDSFNLT
ncbi:MAG: Uma2 family endonuclease, partial [Acidobacteriota bacterium]